MFKTIKNALKTPEVRKKLLYTLLLNVKRIGRLVYPYMPQSGSYIDENMVLDNNTISVPADPKMLFSRLDEEVEVERIYDNMK